MDVSELLDGLNDAQRAAVTAPEGRCLVLAGAGSGKTRVLTHRAAWLIRVLGAEPWSMLAVTFTNKAAGEMRGRIEALLSISASALWVGTFHGLSHRLLRLHAEQAGLAREFRILDAEDQRRLVKRVMADQQLDESRFPLRQVQGYINARKEEGQRAADLQPTDAYAARLAEVYAAYERACQASALVDFAELLLRSFELLQRDPELRGHYRRRFRHLLVDEFQDTNAIQYRWLRQLAADDADVFIVGDDDQSIYGWRGARVENLQRFRNDWPDVALFRLEQNYRSTRTILEAANHLIARNTGRLGKALWTEGPEGEPIALYAAFNELDEARFVAGRIQAFRAQGVALSEMAVLYRSNAQSRSFEETLIGHRIPYRVYGGLRFFERAEIKDALAYLRLLGNRADNASLERIINVPPRGIGNRTVESLRASAREQGISLWEAIQRQAHGGELAARARNSLRAFMQLVEGLTDEARGLELADQVDAVLRASGLVEHYRNEKGERGQERVENLNELVSAARSFDQQARPDEDGMQPLEAFLAHAALEAGDTQADAGEEGVQLMTLHSAKGLEFPVVFLTGLEEGLFPHRMSLEEPGRLEEERRLCYVGITRARQRLLLTFAEQRRLHGLDDRRAPSRFVRELPGQCLQEVRARFDVSPAGSRPAPAPEPEADGLQLGQRVRHARFGEGVVLNCEGSGASARIQVNFVEAGPKWLIAGYAALERL